MKYHIISARLIYTSCVSSATSKISYVRDSRGWNCLGEGGKKPEEGQGVGEACRREQSMMMWWHLCMKGSEGSPLFHMLIKEVSCDVKRLKCKIKFSPFAASHWLVSLPPGDGWLGSPLRSALYEDFPVFGNNYCFLHLIQFKRGWWGYGKDKGIPSEWAED